MISLKGSRFPPDAVLYAVFFYVRYPVSFRDLEEILAERGVRVDHAILNRWAVTYSPLIAEKARSRKSSAPRSWRVDETYIKVKGKWNYYYRAMEKHGKTLDFMLSEKRDLSAAGDFFWKTIQSNGVPDRIVVDKSGSNKAGLNILNDFLYLLGIPMQIKIIQAKYLNNIIEQTIGSSNG